MKNLNLILWLTQLGYSVAFPLAGFTLLAVWLQRRFDLGIWVMAVCGVIGFLTSISTAKSCLRSLLKARDEVSPPKKAPVSFNDHN